MLGVADPLHIVRVGSVISYSSLTELGECIIASFRGRITRFEVSHHDAPNVESIDAHLLTMVLHSEFRGHTLGITGADLRTDDEDEFYSTILGGKNPRNDVAVVSIRRLMPENLRSDADYRLLLSRTLKVSLHEVGHNLGLTDHNAYRCGPDGSLCPMSKGEFNRFGYKGYVEAVVDGRGVRFCEECSWFLGMADAARRSQSPPRAAEH